MNKCNECFVTLQFAVQAVILHIIHNQKLPIWIMNSFRSATKFAVKSLNGLVHIIIIISFFFWGGCFSLHCLLFKVISYMKQAIIIGSNFPINNAIINVLLGIPHEILIEKFVKNCHLAGEIPEQWIILFIDIVDKKVYFWQTISLSFYSSNRCSQYIGRIKYSAVKPYNSEPLPHR